jgi:hypothetical protein
MFCDVLTINEVVARLKHAEKNVYAMPAAGKILDFKIRAKQRIRGTALDQWIDAEPRSGGGGGRGE